MTHETVTPEILPADQETTTDLCTTAHMAAGPLTVGQLLGFYLENHLSRLPSYPTAKRLIRQQFGSWQTVPVEKITRPGIVRWQRRLVSTPGAANKALQTLRAAIRYAKRMDFYAGPDPTADVTRFPTTSRHRFVVETEMPRLLHVLHHSDPISRAFFLVLLFTASRPTDVRRMDRASVDLTIGQWFKPTTKTGQPRWTPLLPEVVHVLEQVPTTKSRYFFPGSCTCKGKTDQPITAAAIRKRWYRIRDRANLPDVWSYDMRRTCASYLAIHGENLPTIQHILGHTSLQHTAIYARMNTTAQRAALERNVTRMMGAGQSERFSASERNLEEWPG